jgi:hypothetical protein
MLSSDPVIEALTEQLACYRRLAKLAHIQHEHVRQSRTEDLLAVLQSRQEVLEKVAAFEQIVGPAKREWAEYVAKLDAPQRERAESLLGETRSLLQQITSADRDDAMVLQQRKLNLGKQINQATVARKVNRNYAAAAYGRPPSRMDVQR